LDPAKIVRNSTIGVLPGAVMSIYQRDVAYDVKFDSLLMYMPVQVRVRACVRARACACVRVRACACVCVCAVTRLPRGCRALATDALPLA
jgi:hypothetical protein